MSETDRLKARSPRGFADRGASELAATRAMTDAIRKVYELWGFEEVETPFVEYTDALGKFLPDQDRPNAGVFSFKDDDDQWLSLRYDLTAPLARFVAQNYDALPKPYRSYRSGPVFRNEKPGPGRFRQFLQFDADIVGSASVAADADICMMAADTLEAVGIARGDYVVKVNNRKVLDGVMEIVGLSGDDQATRRLIVLRAIDKLDRLGIDGVQALLGPGRKDDSGDFTKGAGLTEHQISKLIAFVTAQSSDTIATIANLGTLVVGSQVGEQGVAELAEIAGLIAAAGYEERVRIDPSVVRGLEYYTGPVYEAELTFEITDEDGRLVRFGSVAGGGRYDGLVARFRGEPVPATGFSIGVSRLQAALAALGRGGATARRGPVVVLVLDRDHVAAYQALARELRDAGIAAEVYLGSSGMKAQMKYADRRNSPVAIIQGSNERDAGEVTIKDLVVGAALSQTITDRAEWTEGRPAQVTVPQSEMLATVGAIINANVNGG